MEKYGTIPKRFTKAWWEYFWEYYKWHVIIALVAGSMIAITAYQLLSKIDYDITVTYIGSAKYDEDSEIKISEALEEVADDVNQNGKTDVKFQNLSVRSINSGVESAQYTMATEMKKTLELQSGESEIFILDKEQVLSVYEMNIANGLFIPAEEWATGEHEAAPGEASAYFMKIDNSFLEENGFYTDDIYIGVKAVEFTDEQVAAKKTADYILNY